MENAMKVLKMISKITTALLLTATLAAGMEAPIQKMEAFPKGKTHPETVRRMHLLANILLAQQEVAQTIQKTIETDEELRTLQEKLSASSSSEDRIQMNPSDNLFKHMLRLLAKKMKVSSPDGISAIIRLSEKFTFEYGVEIDWKFIESLSHNSNPDAQRISQFYLERKRYFEAIKESNEYRKKYNDTTSSFSKILEKSTTELEKQLNSGSGYQAAELIEPFCNYLSNTRDFTEYARKKKVFTPEEIAHASADQNPEMLEKVRNAMKALPVERVIALNEVQKERNAMCAKFVCQYEPVKQESARLYKELIRELSASALKNNAFKAYLYKTYDFNADTRLPHQLIAEPAPVTATTPPLEKGEAEQTSAKKIVGKVQKKQNNLKKPTMAKEVSALITQSAPLEPILVTPTPKPMQKELVEPLTVEFKDTLRNMNICLYLSAKHKQIPAFSYHDRVYQWLTKPEEALEKQGYLDPNNKKFAFQDTAIAYHGFDMKVDHYVYKWGTVKDGIDANGNPVRFVAITGHIDRSGKRIFCVFGYAIDLKDNRCFHRCIQETTAEHIIEEYLKDNNWKVKLEEFSQ